jgi:hypothetical protein
LGPASRLFERGDYALGLVVRHERSALWSRQDHTPRIEVAARQLHGFTRVLARKAEHEIPAKNWNPIGTIGRLTFAGSVRLLI